MPEIIDPLERAVTRCILRGFKCRRWGSENQRLGSIRHQRQQQGAAVNVRNAEGETALTVSARYGKAGAVEYLVRRGADPEFRDGTGRRAHHYATTWSPWEFVITKNRKLIAQYLSAVREAPNASMADFAQHQAQDETYIRGGAVAPGGTAYVVELQSSIIR